MPDLTHDVTTTPNFDPGLVAIASGWLVYDVGYHTCGGYGPESGYAHEPGCGATPSQRRTSSTRWAQWPPSEPSRRSSAVGVRRPHAPATESARMTTTSTTN